jgi:aminoglycoside/choline kinase family phosphotransferase
MSELLYRLKQYLESRGRQSKIESLTADASTREYFRIDWAGETAIACVYPESFLPREQNYLDVTRLFRAADLPVAEIYDFDGDLGVIVQKDLGNRVLREVLEASDPQTHELLLDEAIKLIPRIQAATDLAFETDSIASRLRFDTEKLLWELNFFKEHYFRTFRKKPLSNQDDERMTCEFAELSEELSSRAAVLCHRDFHAANLMLDKEDHLWMIDHQDARIGAASYDLVSLLLDRITELPTAEWLAEKRRLFLNERVKIGLDMLDEADFAYEFRLQTIQRCLKAAGTFSFQSANRGKTYFIPFIEPMFQISIRAAENLGRFPAIREILGRDIERNEEP